MSKTKNRGVRNSLIIVYGRRCMLCERKLKKKKGSITLHHIIPVSEGGETTFENGGLLCPQCHVYLHLQNEQEQARLNKRIRSYKRKHSR